MNSKPLLKRICWGNAFYLVATPVSVAALLPLYFYQEGFDWKMWMAFGVAYFLTNISITGGYHRYFAHRTYESSRLLRFFYLLIGASAFQGSALKWATDHRRHHRFVDTEDDPYNINQGLFYAHMGWLFIEDNPKYKDQWAKDLESDPWILFQHRYYLPLALITGVVLPTYVGYLLGSALGGFTVLAALRLLCTNHATFFINSLCHFLGTQPYTDKNSARDSLVMAFLALGEGYHNFHHRFQTDYRNGIRWYHWDPTKWTINLLRFVGCARDLKVTPQFHILRARIEMDEKRLVSIGVPKERLAPFRTKIEEAQLRIRRLKKDYRELKLNMQAASHEQIRQLKVEIRKAKREFKIAVQNWMIVRKRPSLVTL